ncbi:MAG: phosphoesterase [marine bacterium B5-7]|nr:MAG: phosphoesterase [marine bacterium B5-7]
MVQRGLDARQEQDPHLLLRDTRTLGKRFYDFFDNTIFVAIALGCFTVLGFALPGLTDFIFLMSIIVFLTGYLRKHTLPFRLPQTAETKDYNDLIPGTIKPRKSRGICYFGNERKTNEELWFNNDDMRTHVLIFGSTGSGKTEALVSIAYNALLQGSGFIYVDGKGDNSLFSKIYSMSRSMGREDDVLLVNFMTGAKDIVGPQENRVSNTLNPFATGSSSMLSQLVVSMMDGASATPDGDMWKGRAISFVEALMKILVYARDQGHILLDANAIRLYFPLPKVEAIGADNVFPRFEQEAVSLEGTPDVVLQPIKHYLDTLPGYDFNKKGKQGSQTFEQHGFITMQLTRVFTSLADTYGHILRVKLAEVDMPDVVLNRRILTVLLPALEKSPDELANLGKVIIATLRAMMASGLGYSVEGTYHDVIERKPTNAKTPFMCILDEYGYYAVKGFAVVPAQARSLGFSAIFAGQDLPAFQKVSKEEAMSIGANTNIKIAMKLEDPQETWEFFSKTAGEAFVTKVDAFQTNPASLTNTYLDTRSSSSEKRARIDLLDLKDQREGEAHIFFKSKIVRARMFYADPNMVPYMRLNQMLRVDKPTSTVCNEIITQFDNFDKIISGQYEPIQSVASSSDVDQLVALFEEHRDQDPIERAVTALIALQDGVAGAEGENAQPAAQQEEIPMAADSTNIFMRAPISEQAMTLLQSLDIDERRKRYRGILLRKKPILDQLEFIERLAGRSETMAGSVAKELIRDMEQATFYPPEVMEAPAPDTYSAAIHQLVADVEARKQAEQNKDD